MNNGSVQNNYLRKALETKEKNNKEKKRRKKEGRRRLRRHLDLLDFLQFAYKDLLQLQLYPSAHSVGKIILHFV